MRSALLLSIVLVAACAPLAPCPCPPPGAKPAPESAVYLPFAFDALPGWPSTGLERSVRAFQAGCPRPGALARACEAAAAVPPDDEAAARRFFEENFVPYALVSSDGPDSGLITGYYEPVIDGSRTQSGANRYPIFGVPEDLIVVDLASV